MSIKDDLEYLFQENEDKTDLGKGYFAQGIFGRFDDLIEHVSYNVDLRMYSSTSHTPKTLLDILNQYTNKKITKLSALKLISQAKAETEKYLRECGYNSDLAEREDDRYIEEAEKLADDVLKGDPEALRVFKIMFRNMGLKKE